MSAVCQDGGEEEKVEVEGAREQGEDRKGKGPPSFNSCYMLLHIHIMYIIYMFYIM